MKKFGLLFASALALLALAACNNDEDDINEPETEYDDAYYAAQATVTSSDTYFTATDNGGEIHFKTEGGSVTLNVDCGCEWIAENSATDLFATSLTSTTMTVTADQNTIEEDLTGTITLMTESQRITFATITVTQTAYGAPEISVETSEWHVPAVGNLTTEVAVESSIGEFEVENTSTWLTVEKTDAGIILTADENGEYVERISEIVLFVTDGYKTDSQTIKVTQDPKAYIYPSVETVRLYGEGDEASVEIETPFEWDYSYDTSNGWFTIERDGNTLTAVALSDNEEEEERDAVLMVTSGDGAENICTIEISIIESSSRDALVLVYTITSSATQITLPLDETVDCVVDWGDGSNSEMVTSSLPQHKYATAGEYNVRVFGTVTGLNSETFSLSYDRNTTLTGVKQWGRTGLTSMYGAFVYCSNLASLASDTEGLAEVTTFYKAFAGCTSLVSFQEDFFKNCVKATDFTYLFYLCSALKNLPTFTYCGEANLFYEAFRECSSVTELPEGMFSGCSKATDFTYAFYGCNSLAALPEKMFKGCISADIFIRAFGACRKLAEIPADLFNDCISATDFSFAFYDCNNITSIPDKLFAGHTGAKNFSNVFADCDELTKVGAGLFSGCSSATNMSSVFEDCEELTSVPEDIFEGCSAVEDFTDLFFESYLTEIPDKLFSDCISVKTFDEALANTRIKSIPTDLFANCTAVTSFYKTFYGCNQLTSVPEGLFDNCTNVTDFRCVFYRCSKLQTIPDGLFDNNPKVTSFQEAFYRCTALTSIPKDLFKNNTEVLSFASTFNTCTTLTSIPEGLFKNNTKVTEMNYTFSGTALQTIPDGLFDSNTRVTTFDGVFEFSVIESIPENLFANCPDVTTFYSCFQGCTSLKTIPSGLFDNCRNVVNFNCAFYNCSSVTEESPYTEIEVGGEKVHVHLYDRGKYASELGCSTPTNTSGCFYNCTNLSDYSSIPSLWK
ncbi:MAG: hypothetical protein LUD72_01195 [Bacteroidales bacterium]|nr:hypothetical protein [Bacteroidales bacterium]